MFDNIIAHSLSMILSCRYSESIYSICVLQIQIVLTASVLTAFPSIQFTWSWLKQLQRRLQSLNKAPLTLNTEINSSHISCEIHLIFVFCIQIYRYIKSYIKKHQSFGNTFLLYSTYIEFDLIKLLYCKPSPLIEKQ